MTINSMNIKTFVDLAKSKANYEKSEDLKEDEILEHTKKYIREHLPCERCEKMPGDPKCEICHGWGIRKLTWSERLIRGMKHEE